MKHHHGRLAVIGTGAWGTTLALVAHRAGTPTTLVGRNAEVISSLREDGRHPFSLPGIDVPAEIELSTNVEEASAAADVVLLVIPTQKLRQAITPLVDKLRGKIVVTAAKGIEIGTSLLPSQILEDVIGRYIDTPIAVLSGPNLAMEIAQGKPGTTVIASENMDAAGVVQSMLMSDSFRVYTSSDVIGVQFGGALKNIIAIGAGIGDGLEAGDNAKAAFITRGISEIARLGMHFGADPLTFAGLSGIGDLICTCSSSLSRNHKVGIGIANGMTSDQILAEMKEVAEGVDTTRATVELARRSGIEMPIAEEMYRVLFEGKSPVDAVRALMMREPRSE